MIASSAFTGSKSLRVHSGRSANVSHPFRCTRFKRANQAACVGKRHFLVNNALEFSNSSPAAPISSARTPLKGISFSVSGFLFTYYCGVIEALEEEGLLVRGQTELAGASGGGLIATLFSCGVSMDDVFEAQTEMYKELAKDDDLEVQYALSDLLNKLIPSNGHEIINQMPVRIAVTRLWPPPFPMLVSEFTSKDDLVGALVAGCYGGGGFVGNALSRRWREWNCLDGGSPLSLENVQPPLLYTPNESALNVCAFPAELQLLLPGFELSDIFPDNGSERWPRDDALKFMLKGIGRVQPGGFLQAAADMQMLRELGQDSTKRWVEMNYPPIVKEPALPELQIEEITETNVESEVNV